MTQTQIAALQCTREIVGNFAGIQKHRGQSVLYLIWREPWMAAGGGTFIDSMLTTMGLKNVLGSKDRYPQLTAGEIRDLSPDFIFLSSEPFPFKEKHIDEIRHTSASSKILLVDG